MNDKVVLPRIIPIIVLDNGYKLVPYEDTDEMLQALQSIVNDKKVYPFVRHGQPWPYKMILETHKAYVQENKEYLKHNNTSPEVLSVTWALCDPHNKIIGRSAIQPGSLQPITSEILLTIKSEYQRQGLGRAACKAMLNWFNTLCLQNTLRWLTTKNNAASIKLAKENGFLPVMTQQGTQLIEVAWGMQYLVFEKKQM